MKREGRGELELLPALRGQLGPRRGVGQGSTPGCQQRPAGLRTSPKGALCFLPFKLLPAGTPPEPPNLLVGGSPNWIAGMGAGRGRSHTACFASVSKHID